MMRNLRFLRMRRFARLSCAVFLLLGPTCSTPGVEAEAAWPSGAFIRAIAASGCIITGGEAEEAYRAVAQKYVARYNKAKLQALARRSPGGR